MADQNFRRAEETASTWIYVVPLTTTVTHIHLPFFEVRTDILLTELV